MKNPSTAKRFQQSLELFGSNVIFHREEGGVACPCRTPEGFRDPAWHRAHPPGDENSALDGAPWLGINPPECNEQGFQTLTIREFLVKAAIQPATRRFVRANQRQDDLLGDIQTDDRIGIFPCRWGGYVLDFADWSEAGEDYILYDSRRYFVVNFDKLPDINGDPNHHYEVGLRLMKSGRPNV